MKIDPRFIEDFNLCMEFYECTKDEARYEKKRVMENLDGAAKCYSIIAAGIRGMRDYDVVG